MGRVEGEREGGRQAGRWGRQVEQVSSRGGLADKNIAVQAWQLSSAPRNYGGRREMTIES